MESAPILRVPPSVFDVLHFPEEARLVSGDFSFVLPPEVRCLFYLDYQTCPIWIFTWGIRSWGYFRGFLMSPTFLEEALKWSVNFSQSLPRELAWFVPSDILGVSALVSGSDILRDIRSDLVVRSLTVRPIVWWLFFQALDCPKVLPDSRVFRISQKDCFAIASDVPGSSIPAFYCSCLETNKF